MCVCAAAEGQNTHAVLGDFALAAKFELDA